MDLMEIRRGLMMGMKSGLSFFSETITIPQNSATLGDQTAEIIIGLISRKPTAIMSIDLVEEPSANNQFCTYLYDQQRYVLVSMRYRNGTRISTIWNDNAYASTVVEGTHYTVVYIA